MLNPPGDLCPGPPQCSCQTHWLPWPWPGVCGLFGGTAQGAHQPGCPRAGIALRSLVAFPLPSSHHFCTSRPSWPSKPMDPPENCALVLAHEGVHWGVNELQSWKSRRRAQSGASTGNKEQPQPWHSWTPPDCSALMTWWGCCRNKLQTATAKCGRAQDWLAEGQGRTTVCLHSLVFDHQGPSGYWWAVFKLICGIPELLLWW